MVVGSDIVVNKVPKNFSTLQTIDNNMSLGGLLQNPYYVSHFNSLS